MRAAHDVAAPERRVGLECRPAEAALALAPAVLVVDRHPFAREGLKLLLSSATGIGVVEVADPDEDPVRVVRSRAPDVVLCDVDHTLAEGLQLLSELACTASTARVVALTASHDSDFHRAALRAGARGVVTKDSPVELILKAIRKVSSGELWFERHVLDAALLERTPEGTPGAAHREELTLRERQVIALIAEGLKNCEIAERMKISSKTVRNHLCSIFAKLDVSDRLGLLVHAQRLGLVRIGRRP